MKCLVFSVISTVALVSAVLYILGDREPPVLDENAYFGPKGRTAKDDEAIKPMKISIENSTIVDMKERIRKDLERMSKPLEGTAFQYGVNTEYLKKLGNRFLTKYDYKEAEKILNKFPSFKTKISGLDIHFQHVKKQDKKYKYTVPLLLIHGWPGSFVEFQNAIPMLTNPIDIDFNFEVIVPSLPGFGFSDAPTKPGLGPIYIAQMLMKLMERLGHKEFYVQGGDWGAIIGSHMAALYPERVKGLHINLCTSVNPKSIARFFISSIKTAVFKQEENDESGLIEKLSLLVRETGYMHLQGTKPDTIGVALGSSPLGLASYIIEKFSTWTNPSWVDLEDGGLSQLNPLFDLNIIVYWITNSITTSMRIYKEHFSPNEASMKMDFVPVKVPTGCLASPFEIYNLPRWALVDKYPEMDHYTVMKEVKAGHFAALEKPLLLSSDVKQFVKKLIAKEKDKSRKSEL